MNFVPPGSSGSPSVPPRLVRRLHVDLCRLASCLCSR
ncbi:putative leader peptide [Actinomadura vinacea]